MSLTTGLPSWRRATVPHEDIREGRISEALFAVNLSRAIARQGANEYRDPKLFFERTYLTRTLKSLIRDVLLILNGEAATNSVIHLQTNFGGGKTHAELAIYHLLNSPEKAQQVPAIQDLLDELGVDSIPTAAVAALPCADLYAGGREVPEGFTIYTLWGEIAYRLGGQRLYEILRDSDERQASPGVEMLRRLLTEAGPNVILIDEMLHYVDKAAAIQVGDSNLGTQSIGFLRELSEAVDTIGHSVLVASLTASRLEDITVLSSADAQFTLSKLEDTLRRVEDSRTPIESSEIYDVVRARLFESVDVAAARDVAAAYYQFYRSDPWKDILPQESRDASYEELLSKSYPFHPAIVKVLYERWGSRPQFQLTRGTLRFLSHLLSHLWRSRPDEKALGALIQLPDVDLAAEKIRAEALDVAGPEWEAVIGADIAGSQDGEPSIAQRLDRERNGLYRKFGLVQGVATSVFMFTQGGQQTKPTPRADVRLAVARPEVPLPDMDQAFDDCQARLYYYYEEDGGYRFRTEPNPNKVLADERGNVGTEDARLQVERVVAEVLGKSDLFNVTQYGFADSQSRETGDVPDDGELQMVVLPPRYPVMKGKLAGKSEELVSDVAENYGKRLRLARNMVLFLAPDSEAAANAIEKAMDWLAANRVRSDAGLMARFSESQREIIESRVTSAANDTKDHVRRAYTTVIMRGANGPELLELAYIPPNKKVLDQVQEELLNKRKIHKEFNPDLLTSRWASLWPATATVTTATDLWTKFARQPGVPILSSSEVLKATIKAGVERELFGYGVLRDDGLEKLSAGSYDRVYLGALDARDLDSVTISERAVLLRPEQVYALFPPVTREEVAMLLQAPRTSVDKVLQAARNSITVKGRVDERSLFGAILEGVAAGLFGYAESDVAPIVRGADAGLTLDQIRFSGSLIREDVPLQVTIDEVVRLIPDDGLVLVSDIYAKAVETYGADRATEQAVLTAVRNCVRESRFGYAVSEDAVVQAGVQTIMLTGYVGKPEVLPPDLRVIRLAGSVATIDLASLVKAAMSLSKLGDATVKVDLQLNLKGDINDHAVTTALTELRSRVIGLTIEDNKQQ